MNLRSSPLCIPSNTQLAFAFILSRPNSQASLFKYSTKPLSSAPFSPMATKSPKWLFNRSFKLSLPRRNRKPSTRSPTSPPLSPLPTKTITKENELQQVFRYFDGDKDGKISSFELKACLESIGEEMSHEEAERAINDLDRDGDGLLDIEDFTRLMSERENNSGDEDLRRAFEMFEAEKGSGCITPKSLQSVLNRLGDAKSYEECASMIRAFDLDRNGVLDFQEFNQMMA